MPDNLTTERCPDCGSLDYAHCERQHCAWLERETEEGFERRMIQDFERNNDV